MLSELCVMPFPATEDTENIFNVCCRRNRNDTKAL
jgi:hypothetical protein